MAGEVFQRKWKHFGITQGLLWDRFGITVGLLPVATNNVSGLKYLETEVFSINSRMWLGKFSTKLETLWDHSGIVLGSLRDHFLVASGCDT